MELNNTLLLDVLFLSMLSLFIGLFVIRVKAFSLRTFQSVYLLIGAANIGLHYFYIPQVDILYPVLSLAAGIIIMLLLIGLFGKIATSTHYETILIAIGLFPWYLGLKISIIYISLAIIFGATLQFFAIARGFRAINRDITFNKAKFEKITENIEESKLEEFKKKSFAILTTPIGFAAFTAALYAAITFSS